jgi:predicted AAA+ superfamily ATPase
MKNYIPRIIDGELAESLKVAGAVLIRGTKACGKSETAKQQAGSVLRVDKDPQVPVLMAIDPNALLAGGTPRLIDEWQLQPELWNYVRHEVDDRPRKGQFILTGSANPEEEAHMHSGAGRFVELQMRTMSWQELGYSDGYVAIEDLFTGKKIAAKEYRTDIHEILRRLVIGGWPELIGAGEAGARRINSSYIKLLAEVDMSRVSGVRRDPVRIRYLLQSLARNTSTITEVATFVKDVEETDNASISRPTVTDYLDVLNRLMVIEDQPAWNTHIRSSAKLRKSPKRHFADVSLAVAALGLDSAALFNDLNYTGFVFESQVIHDLRVYAGKIGAEVYYYRDSQGLEADAIVQKPNGDTAVFEIKLGAGFLDDGIRSITAFANNVIETKSRRIVSRNVIIGSGYAYTDPDGINVIPIGALGVKGYKKAAAGNVGSRSGAEATRKG